MSVSDANDVTEVRAEMDPDGAGGRLTDLAGSPYGSTALEVEVLCTGSIRQPQALQAAVPAASDGESDSDSG